MERGARFRASSKVAMSARCLEKMARTAVTLTWWPEVR